MAKLEEFRLTLQRRRLSFPLQGPDEDLPTGLGYFIPESGTGHYLCQEALRHWQPKSFESIQHFEKSDAEGTFSVLIICNSTIPVSLFFKRAGELTEFGECFDRKYVGSICVHDDKENGPFDPMCDYWSPEWPLPSSIFLNTDSEHTVDVGITLHVGDDERMTHLLLIDDPDRIWDGVVPAVHRTVEKFLQEAYDELCTRA